MIEPRIIENEKTDQQVGEEQRPSKRQQMKIKPIALVVFLVVLLAVIAFGALPRIIQERQLVDHTHNQLAEATSVSYVVAEPSPAMEEFTLPGSTQAI